MLRVTRWSPDTCGCTFEYEWDDTQPEDMRVHSFKKAVKLCEHHRLLSDEDGYREVMSENTRKNLAFAEAQKIKPGLILDEYTWSFDEVRKLRVGFMGKLSAKEMDQLKTVCDEKFGAKKVEVI